MIPRSVQIQAAVGGEYEGDNHIPDGRPLSTAVSQMPSLGTDFTFPSTPSSFSSMGLDVLVPDVLFPCHSTSPLGKTRPRFVI